MNNISRPSIDHGLLSPSGRMSKQARKAAMEREAAKLFPPGFWDEKKVELTEKEKIQNTLDGHKRVLHLACGAVKRKLEREIAKLEKQLLDKARNEHDRITTV